MFNLYRHTSDPSWEQVLDFLTSAWGPPHTMSPFSKPFSNVGEVSFEYFRVQFISAFMKFSSVASEVWSGSQWCCLFPVQNCLGDVMFLQVDCLISTHNSLVLICVWMWSKLSKLIADHCGTEGVCIWFTCSLKTDLLALDSRTALKHRHRRCQLMPPLTRGRSVYL